MQYQTFRGSDVQEALSAVKSALGTGALIQSTRHVSNGRSGGLGNSFVEVVAAPGAQSLGRGSWFPFASTRPGQRSTAGVAPSAPASRSRSSSKRLDPEQVENELGALRAMLEELSATRPPRERARAMLHAAGVEGVLARDLGKGATRAAKAGREALRLFLRERLAARTFVQPNLVARAGRRVIACVGPTGVGKTTTLAKLAAKAHLDLGRSVSVISLDTFRVGATDQWQRYARLIGIPFDVADSPDTFEKHVRDRNTDIVLVDTTGRASSDAVTIPLDQCLSRAEGYEADTLLVVPAWLRAVDAERIHLVYTDPEPTGVVVTKLDETTIVGGSLHAALPAQLPFAYLCDGPRVPEDIHEASVERIVDAVLLEL